MLKYNNEVFRRIMKKIITYGTFDLLHTGHINLLRRSKKLGDQLIVGLSNGAKSHVAVINNGSLFKLVK